MVMKIGTFLTPGGEHLAGWRMPESDVIGSDFGFYRNSALMAERAALDFVFLADVSPSSDQSESELQGFSDYDRMDPLTVATALAAVTSRIGIVSTASTTYNEPFHIARKLASIDHLSGGRVGWNVVTTMNPTDAYNFGSVAHASHADRYERANEFVDVVDGLWNSWSPADLVRDKLSGRYFANGSFRKLNHIGKHFNVRGPLDVVRPVQGRPVIVQAGTSSAGMGLAGRYADVVFISQMTRDAAHQATASIKEKSAEFGRSTRVLAGVMFVLGTTESEAQDSFHRLQDATPVGAALARLSQLMGGVSFDGVNIEASPEQLPEGQGLTSRRAGLLQLARAENINIRQLAQRVGGTRGHFTFVGTPERLAALMSDWHESGACDGFLVMPARPSIDLSLFCEKTVTMLQQSGHMRRNYQFPTFRQNLAG